MLRMLDREFARPLAVENLSQANGNELARDALDLLRRHRRRARREVGRDAKKQRPVAKKPKTGGDPKENRDDLQERQQEQMQNADRLLAAPPEILPADVLAAK